MEFYVIFFRDRCMGFQTDKAHAYDVADILGPGSDVEACSGESPTCEATAAAEHNGRRAKAKQAAQGVHELRSAVAEAEPTTLELSADEIGTLVTALSAEPVDGLSDDPWADEPTQTLIVGPGESGFFQSKAG